MLPQTIVQTVSYSAFFSRDFLALLVLMLAVINGLMLFWRYATDRPILRVKAVHPTVYQWFFRLPAGKYQGMPTRKVGILVYFDVINRGRRAVQLESWRLRIRSKAGQWSTLEPLSIPEPSMQLAEAGEKRWPVLGIRSPTNPGTTLVPPGGSIGGFAYYFAEWWGTPEHDLDIADRKTTAIIEVRSILGNHAHAKIILTEITLEKAKKIVKGIDTIDSTLTVREEQPE